MCPGVNLDVFIKHCPKDLVDLSISGNNEMSVDVNMEIFNSVFLCKTCFRRKNMCCIDVFVTDKTEN